jgi:hypothetical protein
MEEPLFIEQFNAGHHSKGAGYSFFIPTKVNRQWQWTDARLGILLEFPAACGKGANQIVA